MKFRFDEKYEKLLSTFIFHVLDNLVENHERFGDLEVLDAFPKE